MKHLRPALTLFAVLSGLTGFIYPLAMTATGQLFFPQAASGSLIYKEGQLVGSKWIGQPFSSTKYFWGRLSATSPMPYNAAASGGSNFAATNPALIDAAKSRLEELRKADPHNSLPVPVDLITASGSGLDPHISPQAAYYQIARIAHVRNISVEKVRLLVDTHVENRQWEILGEPRVNVLELNQALDALTL